MSDTLTAGLTLLQSLWSERPTRTAKMQKTGAKYITCKNKGADVVITDAMLAEHLRGKATYAVPLIGADKFARALVIELDGTQDVEQDGETVTIPDPRTEGETGALALLDAFAAAGLVAWSIVCPGAGGHNGSHTWCIYEQEWNPERLQEQSRQILRTCDMPEKEVYPSNANIRLPFGRHVRSNTRGILITQDGQRFELDTRDGLIAAIETVCGYPGQTAPPPPLPVAVTGDRGQGTRQSTENDVFPLDDYNARATREEVEKLLTDAGWTETGGKGTVGYWTRPGKKSAHGHSASLGYVADTVFSVFSTGDSKLPGKEGDGIHYSPAAIYACLKHNAVFPDAAKELYQLGYGTRMHVVTLKEKKEPGTDTNGKPIEPKFILRCLSEGEAGDAQLLARMFDGRLVYDHAAGAWHTYKQHAWQRRNDPPRSLIWNTLAAAYLTVAAQQQQAAGEISDDDARKKALETVKALQDRANGLRQLRRINNVLTLAQDTALLGVRGDEWDADPWLLSLTNGVLDLRSGQLRAGKPTDYIRTQAPTEWHGLHAPCPRWQRFMCEVMSDEAERVDFLQRFLGYALNGTSKEHVLGVFVGARGRNGKRVLFETLQHVLGPYAHAVQTDVLVGQNHNRTAGSAQPHLMALQGKRITYCSETNERDKFSSAQVKNITGGDAITARNLNQNPITFNPSHTLFLQTNYKPQAPADDDALWERVKVIEFKVRFVDEPSAPDERPRDLQLEETLRNEAPGILAWLVRGGLEWHKAGLQTPASVRIARDTYRKEESIDPFITAACVEVEGQQAEGGALYKAYEAWCSANKLRAKSAVWFGNQLKERYEKGRTGTGRTCYYGIALETTTFDEADSDSTLQKSEGLAENSPNPSQGIGTPNNAITQPEFTRFSEGLASISDRSGHVTPHEEFSLNNPSDPSDPSEENAKEVGVLVETLPPPGANFPWASVRLLLEQGRVADVEERCIKLWKADPEQVIAEAREMFPTLAAVLTQ